MTTTARAFRSVVTVSCVLIVLLAAGPGPGALASEQSGALVAEGRELLDAGRGQEALLKLSTAVLTDPDDADAICWLGIAKIRAATGAKDVTEALGFLARAKKKGTTVQSIDVELGRAYYLLNRDKQCIQALDAHEKAHPGDWRVSEWRGLAHYRQGRFQKAISQLNEALARGSGNGDLVYFYLGSSHLHLEQIDQAVAVFAKMSDEGARSFGLAPRPGPARLWAMLGQARLSRGQFADGHEALSKALQLGLRTPLLHQDCGDALMGLGRFEEALAQFDESPDTARNRMARALALVRLRQPAQALPLLDEALAEDPKLEPRIRLMRASALQMMGRTEEADAEFAAGKLRATDPFSRRLYEAIEQPRPQATAAGARWGYRLTIGAGYNDNVTLLPEEATGVVAQELSNQESAFFKESLGAWFRLCGDLRSGVIAQGSLTAIQHEDLHDFDSVHVNGGLLGYWTAEPLRFEAGIDLGHTDVDYHTYAHTRTGYGTVRWLQGPGSRSSLTYQLSDRDFRFPVVADEDRDGQLHIVRLTQELSLPVADRRIYLAPYAEWGSEDTEGPSSENQFWGAGAYVRCPVVRRVDAFASAGYRDLDYDHTHVRSGFLMKRSDEQWRCGAGVRYALSDHSVLTAEWSRLNANSNMPDFFSFEQDVFLVSITLFGP